MTRFRQDNTEGYTDEQLDTLNHEFDRRGGNATNDASEADYIAERAQAIYDTKLAAAALGRLGGKAGTGKAKRRGDSAYYKALRAKVKTYRATFKGKTVRVTIPED